MRALRPLFLAACCPPNSVTIYAGTRAQPGEFLYAIQVEAVSFHDSMTYGCGGVIVSPKIVLTAGHCLDGSFGSTIHVLNRRRGREHGEDFAVQIMVGEG